MISRPPSRIGQRVRFTGYGGEVRMYHVGYEGTVVGRTPRGNYPIIELDRPPAHLVNPKTRIIDRWGCARQLDAEGKIALFPMEDSK